MGLSRPSLEPLKKEESGLSPCKFGEGATLFELLEVIKWLPWTLNRTYATSQLRRFVASGYLDNDSKLCYKIIGKITEEDLVSIQNMDYK